ncbi:zinc metalloprotease HtpX [Streptococcus hyovaginalis]
MLKKQITSNKRRTVLLILLFFTLLSALGSAAGYLVLGNMTFGLAMAVIIGVIYAATMIFQSTKVVMAMNKAKEIDPIEAPDYYACVENMAMVAQLPMPKVYVIEDEALNAFATGSSPENAAVAVTTGLLKTMNRTELEAVIGHEISHIRNYDIRISTIAVALASAVTMISSIGGRMMFYGRGRRRNSNRDDGTSALLLIFSILAMFLAPLAASLVQLAISRQREFLADASSVELTRNPEGMIQALRKLQGSKPMAHVVDDASAALYISDPRKSTGFKHLFLTHPPLEERIKRLELLTYKEKTFF